MPLIAAVSRRSKPWFVAVAVAGLAIAATAADRAVAAAPGRTISAYTVANARSAAEKWLSLVDGGKYAESWQETATLFRKAVTKDQWIQMVRTLRQPLGAVTSRKLLGNRYTTRLPNAPIGKYVVIQFEAQFADGRKVVETITPTLDQDGQWRVAGYYLR